MPLTRTEKCGIINVLIQEMAIRITLVRLGGCTQEPHLHFFFNPHIILYALIQGRIIPKHMVTTPKYAQHLYIKVSYMA